MADNNRVIVELGTVIKNRGEWDSLAQNAKLYKDNVVQYNGSAYIVKSAPASGIGKDILPTNTAYYEVFAGVGEVATGSDFDAPSAAQRDKITTVGAVLDGMNEGVYNLTAKTGDSYATLSDALIAANNTIPTNKKRGGMSICFENSTDNKYVQARCMAQNFTTDTTQWQGVDDEPIDGSDNLIKSGGVFGELHQLEPVGTDVVGSFIEIQGLIMRANTQLFASASSNDYRVYYYPIQKGNKYTVKTKADTTMFVQSAWTVIGYSENIPSVGGSLTNIYVSETTGSISFTKDYIAEKNGYLCITFQNAEALSVRVQVIKKEQVSKFDILQSEIDGANGNANNRVSYKESQALTSTEKETARTNIGAAGATDLSDIQEDVHDLKEDVSGLKETVDEHNYELKSLDVCKPYWTGKIYSQYGTYEEPFVDLKAGYHYTFVARINSVHTKDIYCQIRLIQGDESSKVATFNIPQGDTESPARYLTTNGINFGISSTSDIGYTNRKVYLYVYCSATVDVYLDVFATKTESNTISHNRIIKPSAFDSKSSFCTTMNTAFSNYIVATGICNKVCMSVLYDTESWDDLFEKVNHNFRDNIVSKDVSIVENCNRINNALNKKIYRFVDACKHTSQNYNGYSINTGINGDEPSVIISEDGKYMYLYARKYTDWHYRFKTVDGLNWDEDLMHIDGIRRNPGDSNYYLMHPNVNLIDGVYYLIGASANSGGDLQLFTSTDGLNFIYAGVIFHAGHQASSALDVTSWGNVTLYKEPNSGKWYLYYEMQDTNVSGEGWHGWEICLATCNDILHDNGDGTVGDWVESSNNPVFPYIKSINKSCGNPDFAKGCDNLPIRVDGKYFIYFHGHYNEYEDDTPGRSDLFRAYSTDLVNWEQEGMIFDNRDDPTRGVGAPGNADHCVIEWHGRTYLFYSWNINDPNNSPYIKMMIDDRPLHELLRMRP